MAGKSKRQLVETLGSAVLHVCKCEQNAGVAEKRVVSSIKVQITFIREALRISLFISQRTAVQNGEPIFYLLFCTKAFHFTGFTHLNKEEGRDYPASTLTPGGKQAL